MPEAVNVIGEKGGGKTLWAVIRACMVSQEYPYCQIVENIGINLKNCHYVEDILRTIAVKIIVGDMTPMEFIIDEAALSGFEARDSHGLGSAIRSYLLALSRKSNSNLWLITQMMSMIEKRGQWLSDFDMLCEAHYESPASYELHIPDYFEYTVYNQNRIQTNQIIMYGADIYNRGLFNLYNTNAVPNSDQLAAEFIQFFEIGEVDIKQFCKIASMDKKKMTVALEKFMEIKKALGSEESVKEALGAYVDYLKIETIDKIEHIYEKEDNEKQLSKTDLLKITETLKEKGYSYSGKGHWERELIE